jgi:hypothetical protein
MGNKKVVWESLTAAQARRVAKLAAIDEFTVVWEIGMDRLWYDPLQEVMYLERGDARVPSRWLKATLPYIDEDGEEQRA